MLHGTDVSSGLATSLCLPRGIGFVLTLILGIVSESGIGSPGELELDDERVDVLLQQLSTLLGLCTNKAFAEAIADLNETLADLTAGGREELQTSSREPV